MNPLLKLLKFYITPYQLNWAAAAAAAIGAISANQQAQEQKRAANQAEERFRSSSGEAGGYLAPYRQFGERRLGEFENWLSSPEGTFKAPTMEEVQAGAGYKSRLGAIESSAAARGGLFSGNALRDIGEFGSAEYGTEYARRQNQFQNELAKRQSLANIGYGAAGGAAGISQDLGQRLAQLDIGRGQAASQAYGQATSGITGAIGQYQGQQRWNDYLDRIRDNDDD